MRPSREELALTVDEAEWGWLKAHLERGGLIIVSQELDLVEAAFKIAADDTAAVKDWIDAGKLTRPSAEQIAAWDAAQDKKFTILIVSPYILIQEKPAHGG